MERCSVTLYRRFNKSCSDTDNEIYIHISRFIRFRSHGCSKSTMRSIPLIVYINLNRIMIWVQHRNKDSGPLYGCVVCERMRTGLTDKQQLNARTAADGLSRFQLSWRFHWPAERGRRAEGGHDPSYLKSLPNRTTPFTLVPTLKFSYGVSSRY